jgi:hypothetical protein
MRFSRWLSLLFALGLSVACASVPTRPSPLPLGQSFELRAGASASVQGGLTMVFERVASDSRCPMDAFCVWAGDATLALRLSRGTGQPAMRELHTQASGSEIVFATYSIKLVSLGPYPRSDRQIKPEDYVATLTVTTP